MKSDEIVENLRSKPSTSKLFSQEIFFLQSNHRNIFGANGILHKVCFNFFTTFLEGCLFILFILHTLMNDHYLSIISAYAICYYNVKRFGLKSRPLLSSVSLTGRKDSLAVIW